MMCFKGFGGKTQNTAVENDINMATAPPTPTVVEEQREWRLAMAVLASATAVIHLGVLVTFLVFPEKRRINTAKLTISFLVFAIILSIALIIGTTVTPEVFTAYPTLCAFQGAILLWGALGLLFIWFFFSYVLYVKICYHDEYRHVDALIGIAILAPGIVVAFPLAYEKFEFIGVWCDISQSDVWWQLAVFNGFLIALGGIGLVLWILMFRYLLTLRRKALRSLSASLSVTSNSPLSSNSSNNYASTNNVTPTTTVWSSSSTPSVSSNTVATVDTAQQVHIIVRQLFFVVSVVVIVVMMLSLFAGGAYASSDFALFITHIISVALIGCNSLIVLGITRQNIMLWSELLFKHYEPLD